MTTTTVTPIRKDAIDEKWAAMPKKVQQSINTITKAYKRKLIDNYDEMNASAQTSARQASFSGTYSVKGKRNGGMEGRLSTRTRKASEDDVFDVHLSDGQLVLGLDPEVKNPEEQGGDEE